MTSVIQHCAGCQKRLPEGSRFCPYCGRSTRDALISRYGDQPTEQSARNPTASATWQLMLVRPDGEQMVSEIPERLSLGRSPQNDIRLDDQMVSRFHARIEKSQLGYEIRDLDSMNGITVNRVRIETPVVLKIGDAITIGEHRLLVQHKTFRCGNCRWEADSDHRFCRNCGDSLTGFKSGDPADEGEEEGTQRLR
ncbi:MAG TPA: FHA domain-containing protein [Anaerolineales bacterium]|nr:FHA domain-containing protein [Anaerolineales bacterium]